MVNKSYSAKNAHDLRKQHRRGAAGGTMLNKLLGGVR